MNIDMKSLKNTSLGAPSAHCKASLEVQDSSTRSTELPVVGVLGGGQLGRMLCEAASQLAIKVVILDPMENCPASNLCHYHMVGSYDDSATVEAFAKRCGVLTVEIEHVDAATLEKLEQGVDCQPKALTIRIIQDKYLQKVHFSGHAIPLPKFMQIDDLEGAKRAAELFGYPLMIKCKRLAYDGRGHAAAKNEDEISSAVNALGGYARGLYVEKWAPFVKELSVVVARGRDNSVLCYPVVETIHRENICHIVKSPANVSWKILKLAEEVAYKAVSSLEGAGIFAVELFLTADGQILLNEVAPRPHNSGLHTIEFCFTSQYEQHLRAVIGLPLGDPSMKAPAAIMYNILGEDEGEPGFLFANQLFGRALRIPGATVHWYDKPEVRKQRKMGHITLFGPSMGILETRLQSMLAEETKENQPAAAPRVGIIMGSDSDLPVMKDAAMILREFNVPAEVRIVSAHQTPEMMFSYASSARERGIQVIIAGAGGSTHLPGMVAALTPLPVIGVPVRASTLDELDSLSSIVQMPRGVPVATVAINNATNAGLLAVRLLGISDIDLQARMAQYQEDKRDEVLVKDGKLEKGGWEDYLSSSNGLLVSGAPTGSLTATSNNNTHQISTAAPVIFTPSVSVSDFIPSGTDSVSSATSSRINFGASETPKVSGKPAFKFGASPDLSTKVSAASTTIIPAGDLKNKALTDPSSGSSSSSPTNFVAFGIPSSGNMTSGLSSSTSNPSANNSQGSLFSSASISFDPAVGTVLQGTSTQSNSFASPPLSNTNSNTCFVSSLSSAQVFSPIMPFGFNSSASSSDTGVVASSSGSTSSLFVVNPTAVSDGSAGGSSSFTTSGVFSFGCIFSFGCVFSFGFSASSSSINAVGSTGGATAPVFSAGVSYSGSASVTTTSFSSSPSSTSAVGSTVGATAPVFSFGVSSLGSASVTTNSFSSSSSSTSAVGSTGGVAPSSFNFGLSNPTPASASNAASSFSNGASAVFSFGGSSSASSSAINSGNSNNAPSNPFGSSLQAPASSIFGSSPAAGFSFGASAASSAPALSSMEDATSSELLLNVQDDHKFESSAGLLDARDSTPQDEGKVEENGPVETSSPSDTYFSVNNSDSAVSFEARTSDDAENGLSQPQNKAAFRMSALEDYVDLGDDVPCIELASWPSSDGRGSLESHLTDSKFSPPEEPKILETTTRPELKSRSDLISSKINEASSAVAGTASLGEPSNAIVTPASEDITAAGGPSIPPPSVAAFDKSKEINNPPSLFSFSSKVADKFPSSMPESSSRKPESSSSSSSSTGGAAPSAFNFGFSNPRPPASASFSNGALRVFGFGAAIDSGISNNAPSNPLGIATGSAPIVFNSSRAPPSSSAPSFPVFGEANIYRRTLRHPRRRGLFEDQLAQAQGY